jgi:hypothetical protein
VNTDDFADVWRRRISSSQWRASVGSPDGAYNSYFSGFDVHFVSGVHAAGSDASDADAASDASDADVYSAASGAHVHSAPSSSHVHFAAGAVGDLHFAVSGADSYPAPKRQ